MSSGGKWSSTTSRYAPRCDLALEIETSSEESDTSCNASSGLHNQLSRSSSTSYSTSTFLNGEVHSQIRNNSKDDRITELGPQNQRRLVSIRPSESRYPKSRYYNYMPPLPVCYERHAVKDLQALDEHLARNKNFNLIPNKVDFVEFDLLDFVIYRPDNRHHPFEIWSLQDLASKKSYSTLLFDGMLCVGDNQRYVQAVPFDLCSIGNYGDDIHEVGDNIWIRSTLLAKSNIYYRLKSPASEYARFYKGFLWLANLAKHFVDYCRWSLDRKQQVSVFKFRTDFARWVQQKHGMSSSFQLWYQEYPSGDFRHAVAANIHFLFKESTGIDEKFRNLNIWSELLKKDTVPVQELKESKTVVTPYVYSCFEHLRFGHLLKPVVPKNSRQGLNSLHIKSHGNPAGASAQHSALPRRTASESLKSSPGVSIGSSVESLEPGPHAEWKQMIRSIQVGHVLSVTKDGENSLWKDEASPWKAADHCWYIYVQAVNESKDGKRSFIGLWLYKPSDTCCAKMKYPYPNELFLSDNCTCSRGRIEEDEVLGIATVEWHGSPSTSQQGFFVRQTYLGNDKFETLKEEHKTCEHLQRRERSVAPKQKFPIGQTVLGRPPERRPKHALEPYEIMTYLEEGTKTVVTLKHLLRRNEIAGQSGRRPNELVYSDRSHQVDLKNIECACLVRFYSEADVTRHSIPTPYDRDGNGNAFYITTRLVEDDGCQILEPIEDGIPETLIQGFNPTDAPPYKQLRGLDLYCGGGNFGRGLEEGGALRNVWAVDCAKTPIHSYYANLKEPSSTKLFCGSVDDQLYQALCGNPKRSGLIPLPGEVDFISAGSPCQGFSTLNTMRNNDKGLKNQSLVASVAAYIDFYRPKYGLLENVMAMAQKGLGRDEDVLSQLICAIVGMGYQLQLFVLDAWSLGSPQSRSRLFVSFAAPGCPPLEHPQLSHSHPANIKSRGLGKLANGESFGHRIHCPTPFEYVTASDATMDLSDIGDGQTYQCTPFPDHVMAIKPSTDLRSQMAVIPTYPRGSSFVSAWDEGRGVMTKAQRALFPNNTSSGKTRQCVQKRSKSWGRVHPCGLIPTIVVSVYPMDARMGTCLHWEQQRILTVMEARRAQGFPDHEVLVGSAPDKWKVIGNSVPRTVSLALGLSLRNAWLKYSSGHESKPVEVTSGFIFPTTQFKARAEAQFTQLSQLRKGPTLPRANNVLKASNIGRPLDPMPLGSAAPISGRTDAITASDAGQGQNNALGLPKSRPEETVILPPIKSLQRRHIEIQETRINPQEKKYQALKRPAPGSGTSTPSTESIHGSTAKVQPMNPTSLSVNRSVLKKRPDNFKQKVTQGRESVGDRPLDYGNDSLADDEGDVVSKEIQSRITGAKRPRKGESQRRIFVNLVSDSEDDDTTKWNLGSKKHPPSTIEVRPYPS
jgi:DNA (cytosine-5)-methyltransferase 1